MPHIHLPLGSNGHRHCLLHPCGNFFLLSRFALGEWYLTAINQQQNSHKFQAQFIFQMDLQSLHSSCLTNVLLAVVSLIWCHSHLCYVTNNLNMYTYKYNFAALTVSVGQESRHGTARLALFCSIIFSGG